MKKGLSILIVMTMLLSMLPVTTAAVVPVCVPDEHQFIYDHDDADSNSYMATVELEETGLNYLLRHILSVDADCWTSGTNSIQHDLDHLIYTRYVKTTVLRENIKFQIIPNNLFILRSQIHPIHPIKID